MKGKDRHIARLKRLSGHAAAREINAALYAGADEIRAEAHRSISAGSVSGKNHAASKPGDPPNRDTGELQAHLEAVNTKPLHAEVRSNAAHARPLEFGTSKMAARPYMRPARDARKEAIRKRFAKQIDKLVKRSG